MLSLPIRTQLSISVTVSILTISLVILFLAQNLYEQRDRDFKQTYIKGQKNLWFAISENERTEMLGNFKIFSRDQKLKTALFKGKFDALRELLGPTATRLKALNVADNMMIVSRDGKVIFSDDERVKEPSPTILKVLETLKPVSDFDLTPGGRLVNLVAFPILDRSDLVGIGVFEKYLNSTVNSIKKANEHDVIIYDINKQLHASTLVDVPQAVQQYTPESDEFWESDTGQVTFGVASIPLTNFQGRLVAYIHTLEDISNSVRQRNKSWLMTISIGLSLLAIAAIGTFWYMQRTLRPLKKSVHYIERIADGDLSMEIECVVENEFRRLLNAMSKMTLDLRCLVSEASQGANEVLNTVTHVKTASEQTSNDISRQQSSLQELSSVVLQLSNIASEVNENISKLETSIELSSKSTNEGDKLVKDSVRNINELSQDMRQGGKTIQNLEEKSKQIGIVLDVIKNIAEQTNLLALNAAIEAARAGESGRGFAVVADEVRTLAARTQESTIEIEESIRAVQEGVGEAVKVMDRGVEQATNISGQAGAISQALDDINSQIDSISILSTQVHTASTQQHQATDNMSKNIQTISEMADSTSNNSSEFLKSVTLLLEGSQRLKRSMQHFRL